DGTLGFPNNSDQDGFDEYSSSSDRNADGLFMDADITLESVPEPASALMILVGGGLIALKRRFFHMV
ncbi:MAG: PEP-CTERM sorting domain-containing protein, partial [Verrucomicrobia bacterium]|nr:PEP-CTERM sorting domain-containing protein [Verrucomicrobiota bacterium]